jgi:hypothetical protein
VVDDGLAYRAMRAHFRKIGATVMPASPVEFGQFIAAETDKYRRVIHSARIEPA